MKVRQLTLIAGALSISLVVGVLSVRFGTVSISASNVIQAVLHRIAPWLSAETPAPMVNSIIIELRLPRFLAAFLVGSGLAMVGSMLQTTSRNDLADPFLFGISSGAAAGAVYAVSWSGNVFGPASVQIFAFVGALVAASIVLGVGVSTRVTGSERLVLVGLAVSFVFGSLTSYLVFAGDQRAELSVLFWSFGGLGLARWSNVILIGSATLFVFSYYLWIARRLDVYLLGDEIASSLGVDGRRVRTEVLLMSSVVTAVYVSITGAIGFIGLMAPHLARFLVGPLHRNLGISSFLIGGIMLSSSDLLCRILLPSREIPINTITSCFGAVFIAILVMRPVRVG
jgi:iron complex transport system permease protein